MLPRSEAQARSLGAARGVAVAVPLGVAAWGLLAAIVWLVGLALGA